jgi:hypothetical protein
MWERYGRFENLASLYPGMDPESMWVAAREGDLFHKLTRSETGDWSSTVIDLRREPAERLDSRDERWERHLEIAERLRDYKRQLVVDFERRSGIMEELPRERTLERLRALGYLE